MDIVKEHLPNAEHAFLAACHSAGGDASSVPDESLTLAHAMSFCGYRGVVGTLWAMWDDDGPALARDFYTYMLNQGSDVTDSAIALNTAIKAMRDRGVPAGRWSTFVHIGI